MYINIEISVKGSAKTLKPYGFYYKGEGEKTKVVVVGCQIEKHYKKQTFPLKDCDIILSKHNSHGDKFSL